MSGTIMAVDHLQAKGCRARCRRRHRRLDQKFHDDHKMLKYGMVMYGAIHERRKKAGER